MHHFLYNKMKMMADTGTGSGGTGTAGGQQTGTQGTEQNGQAGQQQARKPDENNSDGFDLDAVNIWDQPKDQNQNRGNSGNNNNNNNNNNGGQQQQTGGFDNYINSLNFDFAMPQDDLAKFVQSGDVSGMAKAMAAHGRQVYKQALTDSVKLSQNMVEAAVQKAIKGAGMNYQTDKSIGYLEAQMPIAKNPNVAPIAQSILGTFMKKGMKLEEAVESTKKVFGAIRSKANTDFGLPPRSSNSSNRGRNTVEADDDESGIDWAEFAGLNK